MTLGIMIAEEQDPFAKWSRAAWPFPGLPSNLLLPERCRLRGPILGVHHCQASRERSSLLRSESKFERQSSAIL